MKFRSTNRAIKRGHLKWDYYAPEQGMRLFRKVNKHKWILYQSDLWAVAKARAEGVRAITANAASYM